MRRKSDDPKTLTCKPLFKPKGTSPAKNRTSFYDTSSVQNNSKNSTPKSQNRVFQAAKFTPPCGESFYEDDAMMISSTLVNFKERNRTSYQPGQLEVKRENCPGKFKFKSTSTASNSTTLAHKEETDNFTLSFTDVDSDNAIKREHSYKSQAGFVGTNKADCLPIKLDKLQETCTPSSARENDYFGSTSHSRLDRDVFDSEEDKRLECVLNESVMGPGELGALNCTMSSPGILLYFAITHNTSPHRTSPHTCSNLLITYPGLSTCGRLAFNSLLASLETW